MPGDRIGIWSPNNAEWVITQFAAAKAGLILVTINPAYRLTELEYALNKVGCRALVTATAFKTSDYAGMLLDPRARARDRAARPADRRARRRSWSWSSRSAPAPSPARFPSPRSPPSPRPPPRAQLAELGQKLQFDDAINIQFTSGTTGAPKGATLTHHNILNNGFFTAETMRLTEQDRLCIPVPLYHCFGMVMGVLGCLTHGAAMVFPGEGFDPLATLETVAAERCTALYGVPTMFIAQMDHPELREIRRLQPAHRHHGRLALPDRGDAPRDAADAPARHHHRLRHDRDQPGQFPDRRSTIPWSGASPPSGRIHPHLEVQDHRRRGPRGRLRARPANCCTRGYSVMLGYWDDDERTADAIDRARWMHTGDLATIDAEGYCAIVGRIKDMVIRGGENVYPREVEEFLYRHPEDFRRAGVRRARRRSTAKSSCAWIKLREGETLTEQEVRDFCRDQIAHYKIPRYVRFVDEFPMTVTGKMQKFLMRAAMEKELDGERAA